MLNLLPAPVWAWFPRGRRWHRVRVVRPAAPGRPNVLTTRCGLETRLGVDSEDHVLAGTVSRDAALCRVCTRWGTSGLPSWQGSGPP